MKIKIRAKEWLWILTLVSLGIVAFCVFVTFRVHNSLIYPFLIIAIVELWKDVGNLRKRISQLEETITKK